MIPNIVHFIYFSGENSRPFSLVNYLAIKAANDIQKPAYIFVYCNAEPRGNPYWDKMKKLERVLVVMMDAPEQYKSASLRGYPQYQADVVRLERLHKMGGIYLDTDAVVLKPLNDLFANQCAMSAVKLEDDELSFANSTILAQKNSKFLEVWLDRLEEGLNSDIWAWHGANLPALIATDIPNEITILDQAAFLPFHFNDDDYITKTDEADIEAALAKCKNSYVVHLWETFRPNLIPNLTEDYVANADTALTRILRNVLNHA